MTARHAISLWPFLREIGNPVVMGLGLTMTLGYGSLFYAYGVLTPAITAEFAISTDVFFAIFSLGLLSGGIFAPIIGKSLDRHGAHRILTLGSAMAFLALVSCALSPNVWFFGAAVIFMEFAACLVLYEAGFAALTQIYGHKARHYITSITLIAGFASTIFWPLTQALLGAVGWRWTFGLFGLAQLLVALPVHYFLLHQAKPLTRPEDGGVETPNAPAVLTGEARMRAIVIYASAVCLSGFIYSAFPIHMLRIIESQGFTADKAALIAMIMGPSQVISRLIEAGFGHKTDALTTGRIAHIALVACIAVLIVGAGWAGSAMVFATLYGVSQGLISIARGTVPLQLFGPHGYATLAGRITGLRFLINSFAPFGFAAIGTSFGMGVALWLCAIIAALAMVAFFSLKRPTPALSQPP